MEPSVKFLSAVEHIAGMRWEKRTLKHMLETGTSACRVLTAASGVLESRLQDYVWRLCTVDASLDALPSSACTIGSATLAFSLIWVLYSSLEQLCFAFFRTFPYMLWKLVGEPSEELALSLLHIYDHFRA